MVAGEGTPGGQIGRVQSQITLDQEQKGRRERRRRVRREESEVQRS